MPPICNSTSCRSGRRMAVTWALKRQRRFMRHHSSITYQPYVQSIPREHRCTDSSTLTILAAGHWPDMLRKHYQSTRSKWLLVSSLPIGIWLAKHVRILRVASVNEALFLSCGTAADGCGQSPQRRLWFSMIQTPPTLCHVRTPFPFLRPALREPLLPDGLKMFRQHPTRLLLGLGFKGKAHQTQAREIQVSGHGFGTWFHWHGLLLVGHGNACKRPVLIEDGLCVPHRFSH